MGKCKHVHEKNRRIQLRCGVACEISGILTDTADFCFHDRCIDHLEQYLGIFILDTSGTARIKDFLQVHQVVTQVSAPQSKWHACCRPCTAGTIISAATGSTC